MLASGREYGEETVVSQVLQVGSAEAFAAGAGRFGDGNVVFLDQLSVDRCRILVRRDDSRDVPPVAVSQVAAGDLLDEAGDRCCFEAILHAPRTAKLRSPFNGTGSSESRILRRQR